MYQGYISWVFSLLRDSSWLSKGWEHSYHTQINPLTLCSSPLRSLDWGSAEDDLLERTRACGTPSSKTMCGTCTLMVNVEVNVQSSSTKHTLHLWYFKQNQCIILVLLHFRAKPEPSLPTCSSQEFLQAGRQFSRWCNPHEELCCRGSGSKTSTILQVSQNICCLDEALLARIINGTVLCGP